MPSVANYVRLYLKNKPYMLEALEKGIVNLSELSRQIGKETKIKNVGAIKAALRRFSENLQKEKKRCEERALRLLKKSKIKLLDKVTVVISESPLNIEKLAEVKLENAYVYIVESVENLPTNDTIDVHRDCGMVVVSSPPEIEKVPGVVAYLTSLLAWENINVIEFISCYTDTILIVEREDVLKTIEILREVTS